MSSAQVAAPSAAGVQPGGPMPPAGALHQSVTCEVKLSRSDNGKGPLQVITTVPLDFERRVLIVTTSKRVFGSGIDCSASVSQVSEDGLFLTKVCGRGGDFSVLVAEDRGARGTEKILRAMHQVAIDKIDVLLAQAKAHYSKDRGNASEAVERVEPTVKPLAPDALAGRCPPPTPRRAS